MIHCPDQNDIITHPAACLASIVRADIGALQEATLYKYFAVLKLLFIGMLMAAQTRMMKIKLGHRNQPGM